ncbi:unnamed protein product [Danaus chrysippus]|uniref:(African queen) hypothetical protein n=1 Tax=Danaus chrysippus TaxID=151541 RepID=A0A8J2W5V7_9NEOP|nr:unnamed protein product [Danaus chrysippus]
MKHSTSPTPLYPRSTSPLPAPANYQPTTASAAVKRYKYLRRLFKFNQMDFEFAAWQMVYLFIAPQKVFRNFNYRKLSSICFSVAIGLSVKRIAGFVFFVVFIDFIGLGILVSTFFWYLSNKYLCIPGGGDVEWGYAFDVHINAFFPPLSLLHCFQILLFNHVPMLKNARAFLFPLPILFLLYICTLFADYNLSVKLIHFYEARHS